MRLAHIQYLRALAASVLVEGSSPFVGAPLNPPANSQPLPQARFLEVQPPLDAFEELAPFCVVSFGRVSNERDGRRTERMAPVLDGNGGKILRFRKRHMKQRFQYTLNFWLRDPAADILSHPVDGNGIIDQCLVYAATHRFIEPSATGGVASEILPGASGLVTDPARESGLYKLFVEIVILDGLYSVDEEQSLAGAVLDVENPIKLQAGE